MNAPSFPRPGNAGQRRGPWLWNGSMWLCAPVSGVQVSQQIFTTSAPYMPSPGLVSCMVELIGGGGGGGGALGNADLTGGVAGTIKGGGGGGGGAYSRSLFAASLVLGGVNVTIATAGAAGTSAAQGGMGGTTSFGGLASAGGGYGGYPWNATQTGFGGGGSATASGQLIMPGEAGDNGAVFWWDPATNTGVVSGGKGGNSFLAGAGVAPLAGIGSSEQPGANDAWGSGGGGGVSGGVGQPANGGMGGTGICVVTEYCWADVVPEDCGCGPTGNARVALPCPPQGWGYDND